MEDQMKQSLDLELSKQCAQGTQLDRRRAEGTIRAEEV
jgi:hypothetical protein